MAELVWGLLILAFLVWITYLCINALLDTIVLKYLHKDTATNQDLCDDLYIWLSTKTMVTKEEILEFIENWELHNAN